MISARPRPFSSGMMRRHHLTRLQLEQLKTVDVLFPTACSDKRDLKDYYYYCKADFYCDDPSLWALRYLGCRMRSLQTRRRDDTIKRTSTRLSSSRVRQ